MFLINMGQISKKISNLANNNPKITEKSQDRAKKNRLFFFTFQKKYDENLVNYQIYGNFATK